MLLGSLSESGHRDGEPEIVLSWVLGDGEVLAAHVLLRVESRR